MGGKSTDTAGSHEGLSPTEIQRYSRHLTLPGVGMDGQLSLRAARVLVVGAGGLGAPVGLYLAAAGVGHLGLVDFDVVGVANLQRQVLFGTKDIGVSKLVVARSRLQDLNPGVAIEIHETKLSRENAIEMVSGYDLVVDCTDNFPARYLINDACVLEGKPNVYGAVFRFEGQVTVFGLEEGPCYRCLYPEPPPPGTVLACDEGGVLGVLPGIIGCIQANEVIKLIVGEGEALKGRLLLFDGLRTKFRELRVDSNPGCPICGEHPTIDKLIEYDHFCGVGDDAPEGGSLPTITALELKKQINAGDQPYLLDVREQSEHEFCNIGGHVIPLREIPSRVGELESSRAIVVYCRVGIRSASAVAYLRSQGFEKVWNLRGGIMAWVDDVDASLPKY
jgi:molybdopterin/thiamine biosynthesis adenylyltransferase/rhodanese-related sulfurtransferase